MEHISNLERPELLPQSDLKWAATSFKQGNERDVQHNNHICSKWNYGKEMMVQMNIRESIITPDRFIETLIKWRIFMILKIE